MSKRFLTIVLSVAVACVSLFSLTACSDAKTPTTKTKITVSIAKNVEIEEDEITELKATTNSSETLQWSVSDKSVLYVSQSGKIIGKKPGTATVKVSAGAAFAECVVTVRAAEVKAYDIVCDSKEYDVSLDETESKKITADYFEIKNGVETKVDGKTFTFTSFDKGVVDVDQNGIITPVKEGEALIVVTCENVQTSVTVNVFTKAIKTPADWMSALKNNNSDKNQSFYLANDLDFTGVTYDIGMTASSNIWFSGTIEGKGRTIGNLNLGEYNSIFGKIYGGRISRLNFVNVKVSADNPCTIADTITTYYDTGASEFRNETSITDISVDIEYDKPYGYAVARKIYGGTVENVVINMKKSDGGMFDEKYYTVFGGVYYWGTVGTVSNLFICAGGAQLKVVGDVTDSNQYYNVGNNVKDFEVCSSITNLSYKAFNALDKSVWDITPAELPKVK